LGPDVIRLAKGIRKKFYSGEARLPVLPEAVIKVRAIVEDKSKGAYDIAQAIQSDSTLSSTVLRLANSARFGVSGKEVRNLPAAIQRLGGRRTLQLLIGISSKIHMPIREKILLDIQRRSTSHSLRVATAAQYLARIVCGTDPNEAFLAGLLHDVGILAIICAVPKDLCTCSAEVREECMNMLHREMGGRLLMHWNMPVCFSYVAVHHGIESDDRPREKLIDFVDVAGYLVNTLILNASSGSDLNISGLASIPALKRLGVTPTHLAAVEVEFEDGFNELQNIFGVLP